MQQATFDKLDFVQLSDSVKNHETLSRQTCSHEFEFSWTFSGQHLHRSVRDKNLAKPFSRRSMWKHRNTNVGNERSFVRLRLSTSSDDSFHLKLHRVTSTYQSSLIFIPHKWVQKKIIYCAHGTLLWRLSDVLYQIARDNSRTEQPLLFDLHRTVSLFAVLKWNVYKTVPLLLFVFIIVVPVLTIT